jgi:hypothetical protein
MLLYHQHLYLAERERSWYSPNVRSPHLPIRFGCHRHDRSRPLYWQFHVHHSGMSAPSHLCSTDAETLASYLLWQSRRCTVRLLRYHWLWRCVLGCRIQERTLRHCNNQGCDTNVASDLLEGHWCQLACVFGLFLGLLC